MEKSRQHSVKERNDKSDASFDNEQKLNEEMKKEYEAPQKLDTDEKKREHGSKMNKEEV